MLFSTTTGQLTFRESSNPEAWYWPSSSIIISLSISCPCQNMVLYFTVSRGSIYSRAKSGNIWVSFISPDPSLIKLPSNYIQNLSQTHCLCTPSCILFQKGRVDNCKNLLCKENKILIATGNHLFREALGSPIFAKSKSQKEKQNIHPPHVLENINQKRKIKMTWINRI